MKKNYIKPNIEQLDVELEQMIASSVGLTNEDASVTDGVYNDSRDDLFFDNGFAF